MKTLLLMLTSALLLAATAPPLHAREPVSLDFFYDNLEPYGSWREVGDYGYCWQPSNVNSDWRPYSDGHWVYSDAGWTWDSEEPYGWAVYHYGRWADVEQIGWVWIPGTEWGPGWVSWRHSSNYIGWAPLPPEALFLRAIGLSGWVDDYYDIGPRHYRFIESRHFGSRRMNAVFIDQRQNFTIIHETTNITNITYQGDIVHNGGPRFDQQSRQSDEPIHRYKLERRQEFRGDEHRLDGDQLRSRISGDSLSVLALPFNEKHSAAPRRLVEKVDRAQVRNGWNGAGSPADIEEARARLKSKTRKPDELPPRAKFDRTHVGDRIPDSPNKSDRPTSNRDDRSRRPDEPPSPMKKPPTSDRPSQPKNIPSKPDMNREDKPRKPEAPNTPPTRKSDAADRPKMPKTEPKREQPKQPAESQKPQQDRKPKADPPSPSKPAQDRKPKADPPSQPKQKPPPQAEKKRPDAPAPAKPAPQDKPKNKGKPDEKDKKRGVELN